jgi:hypothetical protein
MFDYPDENAALEAQGKLFILKSRTRHISRQFMVEGIIAAGYNLVIDAILSRMLGTWRPVVWLPLAALHVFQYRNDPDYIQGLVFVCSILAWMPSLWPPFVGDYNLFLSLDFFSYSYRHSRMIPILLETFGTSGLSLFISISAADRHDVIKNGPWAVAPVYRGATGLAVIGIRGLLRWSVLL